MCDPLVGGLIAGAASIASAGIQSSENAALAQRQQEANDQWVAYQNKIHQEQAAAEDQARNAAEAQRQQTLQKVSPQTQQQEQIGEQQRLNTLYNTSTQGKTYTDPNNPSSLLLSGEQSGNQQFQNSFTSQVNQATQQARGRIAALATAQSYGGSFGGLGTIVPQQFMQGGNYINMINDIRQGNLKTYGVEQQVQPIQYAAGPNSNLFGSIGTALGGLAGKGLGASFAGGGGTDYTNSFANYSDPSGSTSWGPGVGA